MWNLKEQGNEKRVYANSETGSKCTTSKVYTDKDGNDWWGFDNLMSLPYTRSFAATKISSLYTLGLSKEDLTGYIKGMKMVLKSDDPEKYEKAFALLLDFEVKAGNATDALKQMSGLVCVYFLFRDEQIDSFEDGLQVRKMQLLEADPQMHNFFLNRQIETIDSYTQALSLISKIALPTESG